MGQPTVFQGALILTAAGIIVKIMGAGSRIILSRLLGGEGIGLYQMAYPIYLLALGLSTAGIPAAISILVAEQEAYGRHAGALRVFYTARLLMGVLGFVCSAGLYCGAGWLIDAGLIRDSRAYVVLVAMAPAIFFVTLLASYRGYFQGCQQMQPTAVSQVVEQLVRTLVMVGLAYYGLSYGLAYAAAGASFGAAPGAAAGLLVLLWYWQRHRRTQREAEGDVRFSSWQVLTRIVKLALPVSAAVLMLPLTASIDLFIVPLRLEAGGWTVAEATEQFGYLNGMAHSLINVPTILTGALAASLIPATSQACALAQPAVICQQAAAAIKWANAITIPGCAGLYVLAAPISSMLYGTTAAAEPLQILSFGMIFLGLHQVTTGLLQGLGRTVVPLLTMTMAAVCKVILSWLIIPAVGIAGAAWATNIDFIVGALLNLYVVHRYTRYLPSGTDIGKTIIATFLMSSVVLYVYDRVLEALHSNAGAVLAAVLLGAVSYGVFLLLTGLVSPMAAVRWPLLGRPLRKLLSYMGFTEFKG